MSNQVDGVRSSAPRAVGGTPPVRAPSALRTLRAPAMAAVVAALAMAVVTAVVGLMGPGLSPAGAHTDLLQGSPSPGQRAGGEITVIDLVFTEPVSEASVTVTFDGQVLPGTMDSTDGIIIRFTLDEPLSTPGRYEVEWDMISFDLDETVDGYVFEYDPTAPEPIRLGVVEEPAGTNWTVIIASVVLGLCLVGLLFLLVGRIEATRSTPTGDD